MNFTVTSLQEELGRDLTPVEAALARRFDITIRAFDYLASELEAINYADSQQVRDAFDNAVNMALGPVEP